MVAPETTPAETDSLRRVTLVIKYFGNESLEVLCFHELKRIIASPTDLEEVEFQVFKACIAYLAQHPKVSTVYAITSFGTKARGSTLRSFVFESFESKMQLQLWGKLKLTKGLCLEIGWLLRWAAMTPAPTPVARRAKT